MLPFTRAQFFEVFAAYNVAVWPAPLVASALGLLMVVGLLRPVPGRDRLVAAGLAAMWIWTGIAYHALHFAAINRAAFGFAALFVLQGLLFVEAGVLRGRLVFGGARGARAGLGWSLVAYAGVLYPLLGLAAGHAYPALPMFGIAPCPVVLFTFGVLLLATAAVPRRLLVIPAAWAIVGGSAAFLLGVSQDWVLLAGALLVWPLWRSRGDGARDAQATAG